MSIVCCYICHHRLRSNGDLYDDRNESTGGSCYRDDGGSVPSASTSASVQCRRRRTCHASRRERVVRNASPRTSNSAAFMCLAVVVLALLGTHGVSGFACHPKCSCIWRNGKKTATCHDLSLTKVPNDFDRDLQVLDLKGNRFPYLPRLTFVDAGLTNLQKLYLPSCGLEQVDEMAFDRLTNMIELDFSQNYLNTVPTASFRHLKSLRTLTLSRNKITFLGQQAFADLKNLVSLEVSFCQIDSVAAGAFEGLDKLSVLKIEGNRLETLSGKAVLPLKSLNGIVLDLNPWRCDCELRPLRQWLEIRNIPYVSPTCEKPARLSRKSWKDVIPEEFACPPAFLNTSSAFHVYEGTNVTLECKTTGDPLPTIQWFWRDRVLGNLSEGISPRQIFTVVERGDRDKYSSLTVTSVQEPNGGTYSCKAENVAAKVAKNFTVHVSRKPVTETEVKRPGAPIPGHDENAQEVKEFEAGGVSGGSSDSNKDTLIGLIVGVVGGALLVLIIFAVVLFVCRRRRRDRRQRAEASSAGGPLNKLAPMDKVPDCVDEADTKLLTPRPQNVSVLPPAYLHQHEMEPLEPLMDRNSLSPHVWVVKDHVPPEWPPRRSPIPVPMPVAPTSNDPEANARLHNELADTLRRKGDRRVINERERGDGSSEMEATEDPDGLKAPPAPFETLRVRELQDRAASGDEPDLLHLERPKRTQPMDHHHHHPQYQPSTLDRRGHSPALSQTGSGRPDWGDAYDHPSAYFRPVQSTPVPNPILHVPVLQTVKDADDGGGSDGTEV